VLLTRDTVQNNQAFGGPGGLLESVNLPPTVLGPSSGIGGGVYIALPAAVDIDAFTMLNTVNNTDSSGTNGSTANIDGPFNRWR
jgi:hypothetical protein